MQVFIRKGGFWNAKSYKFSSQFGHIMICIDDKFYSFTQSDFLEDSKYGCVQIITKKEFEKTYKGQIWNIVELTSDEKTKENVIKYFKETAKNHNYSIVNNCALECQQALNESKILNSNKNYVYPWMILSSLKKDAKQKISKIEKIII